MKLVAWLGVGVLGGIAVGAAACGSDVTDSPAGTSGTTTSSSGQGGGGGGATTGTSTTGTGQGGATTGTSTTGQGGAGGAGGGAGQGGAGGGGFCLGCADVVNGGDANAICTMNGPPSSSDLLASMIDCLCVGGCAADCGDNACMGNQASQACQGCALSTCGNEVQACLGDGGNPPPVCVSCDDVLGGGDPAALCTMNGPPSSSDLWNAFSTCACVDSCANECGAACQGGQPDQACLGCVQQSCGAELQACTSDGAPPPPVCETCSGALNGGDQANLCTMNGPPSSQEIFDAFAQCACVDSCANQCAGACNGGQPSNACQSCLNNQCGAELNTCLADM